VTNGSRLESYANFLRNFRNNAIENSTAGREFLLTFNSWYYSWAPSLSYAAANNPVLFKTLQAGVVPLIGIFYASYYSYNFMAPLSTEVAAITAGIVAASLIGAIYIAPGAYVVTRLIGRHRRSWISRQITTSSAAMFGVSALVCVAAYLTGSGQLLAIATSSMVLTMLSLGAFGGIKVLTYMQMPVTNFATMTLTLKRFAKTQL
jgi:hypothetical protein